MATIARSAIQPGPGPFRRLGASAGGHLVALLGTCDDSTFPVRVAGKQVSCRVQAVCDWFGPADFLHWGELTVENPGSPAANPITRLLGGKVVDKQDLAKKASPVRT